MTTQDIITLAQHSELKQLAISNNTDVIINFVNLGLVELYKRFMLKTKEYIIEAIANVDKYKMPDDYMWILKAYHYKVTKNNYMKATPSDIEPLAINDDTVNNSVNSIGYNMVQIGNLQIGHLYSLVYVASPTKVSTTDLTAEIPLPEQFIEPLLNYIGYLGHSTIDPNVQQEGNAYYTKFEMSIQRALAGGMFTQEGLGNSNRLEQKGFV